MCQIRKKLEKWKSDTDLPYHHGENAGLGLRVPTGEKNYAVFYSPAVTFFTERALALNSAAIYLSVRPSVCLSHLAENGAF